VGIDPNRLEMFNLSAAQGLQWAEICRKFTELISSMGPSPVRGALEIKKQIKEQSA